MEGLCKIAGPRPSCLIFRSVAILVQVASAWRLLQLGSCFSYERHLVVADHKTDDRRWCGHSLRQGGQGQEQGGLPLWRQGHEQQGPVRRPPRRQGQEQQGPGGRRLRRRWQRQGQGHRAPRQQRQGGERKALERGSLQFEG